MTDASSGWVREMTVRTPTVDRAELARRSGVDPFVVDLVIDAGLLTPSERAAGAGSGEDGAGEDGAGADGEERFESSAVDMLVAARTLVSEGVAVEELAALAMRHAAGVEAVIDDAIDLFKRHADRAGRRGADLVDSVQRLVPVATQLVAGHFERTLTARALSRLGDAPSRSAVGAVVVSTRRLAERVDPLAVFAAADAGRPRSLWTQPESGLSMAAVGVAEAIEPCGPDRFSSASAARAMLEARVRCHRPEGAPAPVLLGGFSFAPSDSPSAAGADADAARGSGGEAGAGAAPVDGDDGAAGEGSRWASAGFGDCRLVLAETTVIDRPDGCWLQAAARVEPGGDEAAVRSDLERRLEQFASQHVPAPAPPEPAPSPEVAESGVDRTLCDLAAVDDDYLASVDAAVDAIARRAFRKVVLARTVTLDVDLVASPAVMPEVLKRLADSHPSCAVFAFAFTDSVFFGATPEELVTLDGPRLHATALAGTAARGATPAADDRLAAGLLASAKNRSEHRFVVDGITEALAGLGLVDPTPDRPGLLRLARLQHLSTPITARVRRGRSGMSDMDVLRVAGALHPTPAVGGTPTEAALDFIAERERFDRGWYAAPVGWCDLDGNGELRVALRSGLAKPGGVRLFAGAGIVADSQPEAELEETAVKLRALLEVIEDACGAGS